MTTPTVDVRGVDVQFGRTHALRDVTFGLHPGVTGLLGPNGAGKTTLLRLLATAAPVPHGRVTLLGHDAATAAGRLAIRRRLGYLPQEPGFHRHFTAFEFVDYVAILKEHTQRRDRHDEVRRVLDLVGLGDVRHKRIKALSGGMRRRVGLAQALLGDPALLLLDEPTSGLDPEQRMRFRELLSDLGERRTVVLSTHQTEDVAAVCQRIVALHKGSVCFTGTPEELRGRAEGHVWVGTRKAPGAWASWRTGAGGHRSVGATAPPDGTPAEPTLEDGYLLLLGDSDVTP
ncbi:ATP-binding cassette domain-containing protein [Longispora sp. K20-0274]|uniref:ATP-binding cassette domain-containing protein n=1 Tax=Longispora sp. K20-0274 TaxID=3088255 RepID=UPI003999F5A6